jgi:hypothetical protein
VIAAWRNAIDLDHVVAMRAVIVLTPLVLLAMISGDGIWLRAALATISTFIAMGHSESIPYLEALVATALAVGMAAYTVMAWQLGHVQWMIWSTASVITGDLTSGRQKLRDRMVSALMGFSFRTAPLHTTSRTGRRADLGRGASLCVRLRSRRDSVSLALVLAGQSFDMAAERVSNVIVGGLIGLTVMYAVRVGSASEVRGTGFRVARCKCVRRGNS